MAVAPLARLVCVLLLSLTSVDAAMVDGLK